MLEQCFKWLPAILLLNSMPHFFWLPNKKLKQMLFTNV